ncbi:META domain-containing protein [Novosphingobium sp.]|uniref:META domain-containing protein n=1 Tax=Novosphingobium sp. TaxID=1874826 RepID=UPI0025EA088B|nr:META domain-containing protein [Novosphingobium sp.]MCC6926027.1 META domain-containing protein [Novosphingobium sp.]
MINRLSLPLLVLLAACSATTPIAAEPGSSSWTFVAIDGKPPVSSKTSLTLSETRIGANVGCNGMGGDLKFEPGRLVTSGIFSTMMYCDGLMEQERAVVELLEASPTFFIEGDRLGIKSDQHSALLVKKRD